MNVLGFEISKQSRATLHDFSRPVTQLPFESSFSFPAIPVTPVESGTPQIGVDSLAPFNPVAYAGQQGTSPWQHSVYDGDKFYGGFGETQLMQLDYWTLRRRSAQLFNENLYARGLIRRLITNEINTGLTPEAGPDEAMLGLAEDSLSDWTETVETRYGVWGKSPLVCDWNRTQTFGAIQRAARLEALVAGDVLVVIRNSRRTNAPAIQLITGDSVQTPIGGKADIRVGHTVKHGVERDASKRIVAYWIRQVDGLSYKRMPAFGEKSGRRLAWLVFGTEKRLDEERGTPLLSLVLQSLKEIDRYRDSTQRKAVINSILAMFIEKGTDKPGTLPISGGAVRKDEAVALDSGGPGRSFGITQHVPGLVLEELQMGEKPVAFGSQGTDTDFGTFEAAVIQAIAWANELPPEILTLAFSNNYSASQAAINEFKIYLNKFWSEWGEMFCTPIYIEWLVNEALHQKVTAPGMLEAWRDIKQYDIFGAWTTVEWYGSIKPSTDLVKQTKGSKMLTDEGWSTNAREARGITGTKFSKNIKRLARENRQKAEAMRPLLEIQKEFGAQEDGGSDSTVATALADLESSIEGMIEESTNAP